MAKADWTAAVAPKCEKIAAQMGFELVDICLDREPAGKYLRIYIDKPEGISLDDCEAYHKAVRPLMEKVDYDFMEVSSPGLDRPLKKDRDFERALGSEIEIRLYKALDGAKVLTGILAGLEAGNILLETAAGLRQIPRKAAAQVRPVVDMEGIEEVDLSGAEADFGAGDEMVEETAEADLQEETDPPEIKEEAGNKKESGDRET